jgi:3-hydroxyisobutyrate dehydrogenase-like beta-hydroxyacid dehydrogenase
MAKLAFCGLGLMGSRMAARFLSAGHDVTVWDRTPEKETPLVELGARPAKTPAEAAAGAEAAVTMLANPEALEQVVFGGDGLADGLAPGTTLIEMSTVGPGTVRRMAGRLGPDVAVMDAPVLGSLSAVEQGVLKIFVGGPPELLERWRPVLQVLGRPIHFGPLGTGAAMKLVANSTLGALMPALGEALALAKGLGLDRSKVLDVLVDSPIGVTASGKRSRIESGEYPPNFKLALAVKDLDLVLGAAEKVGVELRLAAAAKAWFEQAAAHGLGEMDYSAVIAEITGDPAALPG